MDENVKTEKPQVALFRLLINITFGNLIKWKVLANPKELLVAREHNLISMFVNPKTQMHSLKVDGSKDIMAIDPKNVDAIILGKDRLTIIGNFNVKDERDVKQKTNKKDNIKI